MSQDKPKDIAKLLFSRTRNVLGLTKRIDQDSPSLTTATVTLVTLVVLHSFPLLYQTMTKKGNEFLNKVLKEYENLLKRKFLGVRTALVRTAVPLTEEEQGALNEKLALIFGQYLRLKIKVEPGLLGGLVIKVGDKIIDRSLLGKLESLGEYLEG